MEKIVVDYVYKNYFSARSKAREDVNRIAQENGFTPFLINTRTTTEQSAEGKQGFVSKLMYNFRKFLNFDKTRDVSFVPISICSLRRVLYVVFLPLLEKEKMPPCSLGSRPCSLPRNGGIQ